jgi:hypothetical protein
MNSDLNRHWLIEGWTAQRLDSQMLSSVAQHLADTTGKCIYLARKGTWVLTTPEGIRSRKPLKIEIVAAGDKVEGVFPDDQPFVEIENSFSVELGARFHQLTMVTCSGYDEPFVGFDFAAKLFEASKCVQGTVRFGQRRFFPEDPQYWGNFGKRPLPEIQNVESVNPEVLKTFIFNPGYERLWLSSDFQFLDLFRRSIPNANLEAANNGSLWVLAGSQIPALCELTQGHIPNMLVLKAV